MPDVKLKFLAVSMAVRYNSLNVVAFRSHSIVESTKPICQHSAHIKGVTKSVFNACRKFA